jgi:hypothetical protein
MPIKDGKGLARPSARAEDSFALQIIPVRFFSVSEMKKVLTPFLQPGAEVVENPRGNFLIVMDLPSNIHRLMEIADLIDVQVFAGTHGNLPAQGGQRGRIGPGNVQGDAVLRVISAAGGEFHGAIIPLPRINQLLVISHSEAA